MKTQDESVFIGKYDSTFIFKVEGRLTQKSLWNTNAAVQQCMEDSTITNVLVDITQCSYMDSTILGILARWAIAFEKSHPTLPFLVGLEGGPLESIFKRMNLTMLFHLSTEVEGLEGKTLSQLVFSKPTSNKEYAENLLSAHETLAELSEENAKEFAAVIQYLKADFSSSEQ
jgi:anti-anti-sigma regulatory factor